MFGSNKEDDAVLDSTVQSEPVKGKRRKESGGGKRKLPAWAIAVGVLVLAVVVGVLSSKFRGGGDTSNFYQTTQAVLSNEIGSFHYTFDVRTSKAGSTEEKATDKPSEGEPSEDAIAVPDEDSTSVPDGDAEATPIPEADIGEEPVGDQHKKTYDWNDTGSYEQEGWRYPCYTVTVDGRCNSVDPYEITFQVDITTELFKDTFTDVTFKDGKYYVNVEQMRYWLSSSKDAYLASIANEMPEGSKYLVIPEADFSLTSRYAEADEAEMAKVKDMRTAIRRMKTFFSGVVAVAGQQIGDTGLSTDKDNVSDLNLTGDTAGAFVTFLKGFASGAGLFWDSYIDTCGEELFYSEEGVEQAKKERDNFVSAFKSFNDKLSLASDDSLNAKVVGKSRMYKNTSGNDALESQINMEYTLGDVFTQVSMNLLRTGEGDEIKEPDGSKVELKDFRNKTLVETTVYKVMDYFEFMGIDLSKSMQLSPDTVTDNLMKEFIELVNTSQSFVTVTENNVAEYVKKYANFEVAEDTSEEDLVNALIVNDFLTSLKKVTGGAVRREDVSDGNGTDNNQFPKTSVKLDGGVSATFSYIQDLSKNGVVAVNAKFNGKGTLKADDFELRDLQGSLYKANNVVLLAGNVEKGKLPQTFKALGVQKLYFPVPQDNGYLDLWYKGEKVAVIRAF